MKLRYVPTAKRTDLRHWLAPLHPLLFFGIASALAPLGIIGAALLPPALLVATFAVAGFSDRRETVPVVAILTVLLILGGYSATYFQQTT